MVQGNCLLKVFAGDFLELLLRDDALTDTHLDHLEIPKTALEVSLDHFKVHFRFSFAYWTSGIDAMF